MPVKESEKPAHKWHQAFLATLEPKNCIPDAIFRQIAAVHNSMVGHWGLEKCRERLNDPTITDRTITQFIRQCPCCQVMSRLPILIKTHPFTCASTHRPHRSSPTGCQGQHPYPGDDRCILTLGRTIPHEDDGRVRGCRVHFPALRSILTLDVIHTDQGPAFRNELFAELTRLSKVEHSFATAYSKEENGIVERANQEVMRHLRAILFDARVHDKWSYEQLPIVQRIMNCHWSTYPSRSQ